MPLKARFILSRLAQNYYKEFFLFFLLVMAFSIPTSRLVMSMSQIALATLWLLDGRYREKLNLFYQNKVALILTGIFALHVFGLLYTYNFDLAFQDLRIKLPLLLLPFFFSSIASFDKKKSRWVLFAFIAGVIYASLFVSVEHFFTNQDLKAILSDRFIKHMRFSLNINLAIFSLILLVSLEWKKRRVKIVALLIVVFLIYFTLQMGALSAYAIFILTLPFVVLYLLRQLKGKLRYSSSLAVVLIFLAIIYFGWSVYAPSLKPRPIAVDLSQLDSKTALGNDYYHDFTVFENGKPIYTYVCEQELAALWNERSNMPFLGQDKEGQELKATLIRYLNSKDLRKDSLGLSQLSAEDIRHIENGIANKNYLSKTGIQLRFMQLAFELEQYKNNPNPSGYSLGQRLEYWKVAWFAIQKQILFGSGTGDNTARMNAAYQETNTQLSQELWFHPHQQFLSIWLSFGLFGLLLFLLVIIYPPIREKAFNNPFYVVFFISILFSFFVEDILETQSGATYFAFFNAFFLLLWPKGLKE